MVRAGKRLRTLARETAKEFDATLLHNRVHEQVQGDHTTDDGLTRLVELAEGCYQLSELRDDRGRVAMATFDAAETLDREVDAVVNEQVARACATIVTDAPDWTDHWDEDEIDAAVHEAREWLQLHTDAADRAGVLEEV